MNAIELLMTQHLETRQLFHDLKELQRDAELEKSEHPKPPARPERKEPRASRDELAIELVRSLVAHSVIEREIFYPAVWEALGDDKMLREAVEEHGLVEFELRKFLGALAQKDDADFAAKLDVLRELVEHHVREEEFELLGRAELALGKARLSELGERMEARFEEVKGGDAEAVLAELAKSPRPVLGKRRAA